MLESTDVEVIRDWIIVVYFGLTSVVFCIGIAFIILIAVKVAKIRDTARETMKNVRGD